MRTLLAILINSVLLSALLIAAVWLILRLLPKSSLNAATRYVIWWATLAVTVAIPLVPLLDRPQSHPAVSVAGSVISFDRQAGLVQPASLGRPAVSQPPRPRMFPVAIPSGPWLPWIALAWSLFSFVSLARLIASLLLIERLKKRSLAFSGTAAARLQSCRTSRAGIRIRISTEIATPMAVGFRRPAILIPARLLDRLEEDELTQICLHETAHLIRRDDYSLIAQKLLEAIFAPHPVVRWIGRQIDLQREIACDDFVVEKAGQPRIYAACLARVVELSGGVGGVLAVAQATQGHSHFARRVDMLLDKTRCIRPRLLKARLAAGIIPFAVLAWIIMRAPLLIAFQPPPPPPPPPAVQAVPTPPQPPPAVPVAPLPPPPPPSTVPAPPPPPTPQPTYIVQIPVFVLDSRNRYVTGLEQNHFRLLENNVEQPISNFANQDEPLSVGIIFNVRTQTDEGRKAVRAFLESSNPGDEFFLIDFDGKPELIAPFLSNGPVLESRVALARSVGPGDIAGAYSLAASQMKSARNPRHVLFTISDAAIQWQFGDVHIGDALFSSMTPSDLTALATKAGIQMRSTYLLGYSSGSAAGDRSPRKVQVDVIPPRGLPPLTASYPAVLR